MKVREALHVVSLGAGKFLEMRLAARANRGKKVDTNNNELCFLNTRDVTGKKSLQTERKKHFCKPVGK